MWNTNFSSKIEILNNEVLMLKIFKELTNTCINARVQVNSY